MTETFGTFSNPHPTTWNITNNVIWNLHQGNNKVIAANKEAILVMPNRYGSDSGIRTRTMRNLVPWWNATSPLILQKTHYGILMVTMMMGT